LPDSLAPLIDETANVGYVNSLPDQLSVAGVQAVVRPAPGPSGDPPRELTRTIERWLVLIGFGLYLIWEGRRVHGDPRPETILRETARSSLVYVLLVSTSVQTWYFGLPVALALSLGWSSVLTRVAVGYSVLALPTLYLSYYLREATPMGVMLAYGFLPLVPLVVRWRPVALFSRRGAAVASPLR
jgi:hypothetical protein